VLLAAILTAAVLRRRWLPEASVAVPAAIVVIATGALPLTAAQAESQRLAPVVGFLAAVLVLGQLCESEGLFTAAGARLAQLSRHRPVRLLTGTFALASVTTAVLSLDTTVVLLTPVVHETAARLRLPPKPYVYACTHLANSASLLLPVSNLTNLLAFSVSGLSLTGFTAAMGLPWLVAIAVEYVVFRVFFRADLAAGPRAAFAERPKNPERAKNPENPKDPAGPGDPENPEGPADPGDPENPEGPADPKEPADPGDPEDPKDPEDPGSAEDAGRVPLYPLAVVVATLAGFTVTSFAGINPAWAAFGGALLLAVPTLRRRDISVGGIVRAAAVPFLLFVLCLGLVVQALVGNGLGTVIARVLPHGSSLPALLAIAAIAAATANLVNNLPAVLLLLAAVTAGGTPPAHAAGPVLAILIGVNIGPNLTYAGSLATLLWRRLLAERDHDVGLAEFTLLGLATVPLGLVAATAALWCGLRLTGHG
jgi:arsenical pump membrane protein